MESESEAIHLFQNFEQFTYVPYVSSDSNRSIVYWYYYRPFSHVLVTENLGNDPVV